MSTQDIRDAICNERMDAARIRLACSVRRFTESLDRLTQAMELFGYAVADVQWEDEDRLDVLDELIDEQREAKTKEG